MEKNLHNSGTFSFFWPKEKFSLHQHVEVIVGTFMSASVETEVTFTMKTEDYLSNVHTLFALPHYVDRSDLYPVIISPVLLVSNKHFHSELF